MCLHNMGRVKNKLTQTRPDSFAKFNSEGGLLKREMGLQVREQQREGEDDGKKYVGIFILNYGKSSRVHI